MIFIFVTANASKFCNSVLCREICISACPEYVEIALIVLDI